MREFLQLVLWLSLSLILGFVLQNLYFALRAPAAYPWLSIAIAHSLLAGSLLTKNWQRFKLENSQWKAMWVLGPGLSIALGALVLALVSRSFGTPLFKLEPIQLLPVLGLVFWVPIVEELVFRFGLSSFLQSRLGRLLGIYLTSLIFALAHGDVQSAYGILPLPPLGPFLLAFFADLIYWRGKSIWGAIIFHSACNATPLIFQAIDARWLDWLKLLYLRGVS